MPKQSEYRYLYKQRGLEISDLEQTCHVSLTFHKLGHCEHSVRRSFGRESNWSNGHQLFILELVTESDT